MKNSSLFKLLSKMPRSKIRRWQSFIASPYFNKRKDLEDYANYLADQIVSGKVPDDFSRKDLFLAVSGEKDFDDGFLRWVISSLLRLTERFLAIEYQESVQHNRMQLDLIEVLHNDFDGIREDYHLKKIKTENLVVENRYRLLQLEDRRYLSQNDFSKKALLQDKIDFGFEWSLTEALETLCEQKNRAQFMQLEIENSWGEWAVNYIEHNPDYLNDRPVIHLYYLIYNSVCFPDAFEEIGRIDQLIDEISERISFDKLRSFRVYQLNFCLRKINSGDNTYLVKCLDLFEKMLDKKLLLDGGFLPIYVFKNILTIGLRLKKLEWVKRFVKEQAEYLNPDVRENAYQYSIANIFYAEKEYEKSQHALMQVEFTDINYNLDSKALLLRIYFETEEEEALEAHFNAFKIYLIRNKLISNKKHKRYYNLFRFTRKMSLLKSEWDYKSSEYLDNKLKLLRKQIDRAGSIANKNWLNAQLAELT